MAPVPSAFSAGCAGFVALLLLAEKKEHRAGIAASKTLASLAFLGAGLFALPLDSTFGRLLLLGLVLSAIGDVLLIPKSERAFTLGLGSFLLGHVAYGAAFVVRGVSIFAVEAAAIPAVIAAVVVLMWLLPRVPTPLRGPVVAYAIVISAMVALAAGATAGGGTFWIFVAAMAFYLSDLSVARDRFVAPGFVNRAWGLPLYYAAQLVFASLAR